MNTGDWVESCTAIAETHSGELVVVDWLAITRQRAEAAAGRLVEVAAA